MRRRRLDRVNRFIFGYDPKLLEKLCWSDSEKANVFHYVIKQQDYTEDSPGGAMVLIETPDIENIKRNEQLLSVETDLLTDKRKVLDSTTAKVGYKYDMQQYWEGFFQSQEDGQETHDVMTFYLDEECTIPAHIVYSYSNEDGNNYFSGIRSDVTSLTTYPTVGFEVNGLPSERIPWGSTIYVKWENALLFPKTPTVTRYKAAEKVIKGTCETVGAKINVIINQKKKYATTVAENGEWEITLDETIESEDIAYVYAYNNGKNSEIITAIPSKMDINKPVITQDPLDFGNTIAGTHDIPGATIRVNIKDSNLMHEGVVDANGNWSVTLNNETFEVDDLVRVCATYKGSKSDAVEIKVNLLSPTITWFEVGQIAIEGKFDKRYCEKYGMDKIKVKLWTTDDYGNLTETVATMLDDGSWYCDGIIEIGSTEPKVFKNTSCKLQAFLVLEGRIESSYITTVYASQARKPAAPEVTVFNVGGTTISGTWADAHRVGNNRIYVQFYDNEAQEEIELNEAIDSKYNWTIDLGRKIPVRSVAILWVQNAAEWRSYQISQNPTLAPPTPTSFTVGAKTLAGTCDTLYSGCTVFATKYTMTQKEVETKSAKVDNSGHWYITDWTDATTINDYVEAYVSTINLTTLERCSNSITYRASDTIPNPTDLAYSISNGKTTITGKCDLVTDPTATGNTWRMYIDGRGGLVGWKNVAINSDHTWSATYPVDMTKYEPYIVTLYGNSTDTCSTASARSSGIYWKIEPKEDDEPTVVLNEYPIGGSFVQKDCVGYHIDSNAESIASYAFQGCSKLKSIVLPESVKAIEDFAFDECTALEGIYITRTNDIVNLSSNFAGELVDYIKIYVPETLLEQYKETYSSWADNFGVLPGELTSNNTEDEKNL